MRRASTLLAVAVATAVMATGLMGCKKPTVEVTSAWPVANAERRVAQPAAAPRWPYRGTQAPSVSAVNRRPLSVKIENSPAARPQTGIGSADVVYETITEGGITRFNCIFQSSIPKTLGPVRSARLSDLWIVPQYDGLFFFSGANGLVNRKVNAAKLPNLSEDAGISYPYSRSSARSAPHNLMLDTAKAYEEAKKRGYATTARLEGLQFDRRALEPTPAVNQIEIPFSQANTVKWVFDKASGSYLRWNNGKVHSDAADGKQLGAENVVVIWTKYRSSIRSKWGSDTYDIDLGGNGRATVFRNGTRVDCTWTADRTAPPRFKAADGTLVRLANGRTWFQIIPLDGRVIMR